MGGVEAVKEQVRHVRAGAVVDALQQDVRYGARTLWRQPLFALTATLSIAIGIGANTTIFTIANALLFRQPAGVTEPDRLVDIGTSNLQNGSGLNPDSYPNYLDIRQRATMLEVHDARIWLEPTAARMAASHITKAELKRLREINAEMKTAIDSSEENIMDANRRFHGVIAAATANLVVQVFLETLLTVVDSGVQDINHSREFKRIAVKGHDEIIDALEAKDPDRAEDAMRRHLVEGKKRRFKENRDLMSRPLRWVQ
jgi:hypothetical protein